MLSRSLLCLAVLSTSTPVLADTVWLKNGDRLSGKIKVFDGGKLLIQTKYAGVVALDWHQVKTLESDQELLVKQDAYVGEKAKSLHAAEEGMVILANGEAPKTVELASIEQIIKPKPVIEDLVWKGNVDVALDYQRAEKDVDDYDVDFKTSARHGKWRHIAEGEYNRVFQNDVVTTDNWSAEYALDRFLTEQWFWQGRLTYKRDKVEDLARQRTVGTGPGRPGWASMRPNTRSIMRGATVGRSHRGGQCSGWEIGARESTNRSIWCCATPPMSRTTPYSIRKSPGTNRDRRCSPVPTGSTITGKSRRNCRGWSRRAASRSSKSAIPSAMRSPHCSRPKARA